MLVSRVLHPVVGVISSFYMQLANGMFSAALGGWFFTTLALGPGLIVIGLVGHNSTLVDWGNTILASENWQFGIGVVVILVSLLPYLAGWRFWIRLQAIIFTITMLGLGLSVIIAIFTSESSFRSSFNDFARGITGKSDTYGSVITTAQHAGVVTDPAFSFSKTLPMVAFVAAFGIYSYFTAFIGGEIRQGGSLKTAHRMALGGVLSIASVAIIAIIFFHSFGHSFLVAAYGGGMPSQISVTPTYFFLTSAQVGNTAVAVFLVASFALFWPLLTAICFLQPTRMIFAYSFDGLLPKGASKVSGKSGAPVVAIAIAGILAIGTLAWAIYLASNVFQVVTYTVLAQVIAMGLVGLSALVFPYRRPELYRASTTTKKVLGIPVVSIAGAGAIISTVVLWILVLHRGEARPRRQAELLRLDVRHAPTRSRILLRRPSNTPEPRDQARPRLQRDPARVARELHAIPRPGISHRRTAGETPGNSTRQRGSTGRHGEPLRVPPVCQSARRVASVTISALDRSGETSCKCLLVASRTGTGPHHWHAMNDCAIVASRPRQNIGICSDFLAPSKPTRGLEPRTPSLRVMCSTS